MKTVILIDRECTAAAAFATPEHAAGVVIELYERGMLLKCAVVTNFIRATEVQLSADAPTLMCRLESAWNALDKEST